MQSSQNACLVKKKSHFWGHVVSEEEISVDPSKVEAIS